MCTNYIYVSSSSLPDKTGEHAWLPATFFLLRNLFSHVNTPLIHPVSTIFFFLNIAALEKDWSIFVSNDTLNQVLHVPGSGESCSLRFFNEPQCKQEYILLLLLLYYYYRYEYEMSK